MQHIQSQRPMNEVAEHIFYFEYFFQYGEYISQLKRCSKACMCSGNWPAAYIVAYKRKISSGEFEFIPLKILRAK